MRKQSRERGENPKNLWQEITCKCEMDVENMGDETLTTMKWGYKMGRNVTKTASTEWPL